MSGAGTMQQRLKAMSDLQLQEAQKAFAGLLEQTRTAIPTNPGPGWDDAFSLLEAAYAALEAELASR